MSISAAVFFFACSDKPKNIHSYINKLYPHLWSKRANSQRINFVIHKCTHSEMELSEVWAPCRHPKMASWDFPESDPTDLGVPPMPMDYQ